MNPSHRVVCIRALTDACGKSFRLTQMAKRPKMEDGQGHGPVMEGSNVPHVPRDPAEVGGLRVP